MKTNFHILFFVFLTGGIQLSAQNTNLQIASEPIEVKQSNSRIGYFMPSSEQAKTKKTTKELKEKQQELCLEQKVVEQKKTVPGLKSQIVIPANHRVKSQEKTIVNIPKKEIKKITNHVISKEEKEALNEDLALQRSIEISSKKQSRITLNNQTKSSKVVESIDYSNLLSDANGQYFQKESFNSKGNDPEMIIEKLKNISGVKSVVVESSVMKLYLESGLSDAEISRIYHHYFLNLK